MKKIFIYLLISFSSFFICFSTSAQENKYTGGWDNWKFLLGDWAGVGSGNPGEGTGYFSFNLELNGKILYRKNHSVYPGHENQPAVVHDDILIVYKQDSNLPDKAIYFDNEGHVINYNIEYGEQNNIVILKSEVKPGTPVYRLTYSMSDNTTVVIKFEIASPDNNNEFKPYLEATALRKN